MGIQIITDSTSEIRPDVARELDVAVVALKTMFGKEEYRDGVDLTPEEFFKKLAQSKELPTTSQPSPWDFEQVFRQAQAEGHQIITITISGALSGTVRSAEQAKEIVGGDIWVVDSNTSTIGVQMLVRLAVKLRDEGHRAEEIVAAIEAQKSELFVFAVVDTLEYLQRGGRLSKASAFAGTLLNMKPIIQVEDGLTKAIGRCRGLKKAYEEVFRLVDSVGGVDYSRPFAIGYSGSDRERFAEFEQMSARHLEGNAPLLCNVGSVMGTHVGPGAVAITFFKRKTAPDPA